jgi:hypothetical protein
MTLEWSATLQLVLIMVGGALISGLIVIAARRGTGASKDPEASVIRSWIAITLVIGLLVLSAATFGISDQTLRSTLIGGLTASAGGAIAYYFSSKSAEQARQALIAAAFGKEVVPDLTGKTTDEARAILGGTTLKLSQEITPPDSTAPIKSQDPAAGADAVKASTIKVTYAIKVVVPPLVGLTADEASIALTKRNLKLSSAVAPANAATTITTADPAHPEGSQQWEGTTIAVTY